MNKKDIILIIVLIVFSIISLPFISNRKSNKATVYYKNNAILNIDLTLNKNYEVKGTKGIVKIIVKNNKIKVENENSPKHLCSKQGYISKSYETIVCLPNEIVIKIEDNNDIDAKVG